MDQIPIAGRTAPPLVRPVRTALFIAVGYVACAAAYILVSSTLASERSGTVEELRRIEILKGIAFVIGSGALLFALNAAALVRVRRNEERARRMERALSNAERSVLAGTFARTIAHDINNGLAVARLNIELLQQAVSRQAEASQLAHEACDAVMRVERWNRRFFELGGRSLLDEAKPLDLAATVRGAAHLARQHEHARTATIDVCAPASAPYLGIEALLERALLNLLLNALEASGSGARIVCTLAPAADGWVITVEDDGPGVPVEVRTHVLEPFFTTKHTGTGLGLASVVACARYHGGGVTVGDSRWSGAAFTLALGGAGVEATPVSLQVHAAA